MTPLYAAPEQIARQDHLDADRRVFARRGPPRVAQRVHCRIARSEGRPRNAGRRARGVGSRRTAARQPGADRRICRHGRATTVPRLRPRSPATWTPSSARRCAWRPMQRYDSVAHLADDLRRFLDRIGRSPRGARVSVHRAACLARHRFAATVGGAGLVLVIAAGVVAWQQHRESRRACRAHGGGARLHVRSRERCRSGRRARGRGGHRPADGRRCRDARPPRLRRAATAPGRVVRRARAHVPAARRRRRRRAGAGRVGRRAREARAARRCRAQQGARYSWPTCCCRPATIAERTRALAAQARDACANDSVDCAKARAYAANILSQLAAHGG